LWLGWALALLSLLAFSIAPPISKAIIGLGINPTAMLVARFVITTTLLASTMSLAGKERRRIDRRGMALGVAAGLINGVGMLSFFWSLTRLDTSVASMVFSVNPIVTLGVLALRGEKYTYRNLIRLGLGLAGLYLLIGPGGGVDWGGVALVAVSICTSSIHLAFLQWFMQGYDSRSATFYPTAGMMAVILGYWLVQGLPWRAPGTGGWLGIVVLAVVCTYAARLLMVVAIRHIGSAQIALLTPLETLLTVVWSLLFLGERLTPVQWLGGVLILGSALLAVQRLSRVRARAPVHGPPAAPGE
jgi:drug/metabolite transporter (DMT)-like permease